MTMGDIYEEMKQVLKFFGLGFNEMHKVAFVIKDGCLIFSYGGRAISVDPLEGFTNV